MLLSQKITKLSIHKNNNEKLLEIMDMLLAQFVVMVSQVHTYLQAHWVIYSKYMAVCMSIYLNKVGFFNYKLY